MMILSIFTYTLQCELKRIIYLKKIPLAALEGNEQPTVIAKRRFNVLVYCHLRRLRRFFFLTRVISSIK